MTRKRDCEFNNQKLNENVLNVRLFSNQVKESDENKNALRLNNVLCAKQINKSIKRRIVTAFMYNFHITIELEHKSRFNIDRIFR